jgi:Flp pilus assembly protein TadG
MAIQSETGATADRRHPRRVTEGKEGGGTLRWRRRLRGTQGAQLLELALSLPILIPLVMGVLDFGESFNLKQKLTNAAREAARLTVSNPLSNANCGDPLGTTDPCEIQAAADAAKNYMINAGLSVASCITPNAPSAGTLTWTYTCNNGCKKLQCADLTLTINKGYVFTGTDGNAVSATQVTLTYPYYPTAYFAPLFSNTFTDSNGDKYIKLTTLYVMQNLVM